MVPRAKGSCGSALAGRPAPAGRTPAPPMLRVAGAAGARTTTTSVSHTALRQRDPGFRSIVLDLLGMQLGQGVVVAVLRLGRQPGQVRGREQAGRGLVALEQL